MQIFFTTASHSSVWRLLDSSDVAINGCRQWKIAQCQSSHRRRSRMWMGAFSVGAYGSPTVLLSKTLGKAFDARRHALRAIYHAPTPIPTTNPQSQQHSRPHAAVKHGDCLIVARTDPFTALIHGYRGTTRWPCWPRRRATVGVL
jgi:hypothetical protein